MSWHWTNFTTQLQRLFPSQPCMLCGDMSDQGVWCHRCQQHFPYYQQPHCPICALPTINGEICGVCQQQPPAFNSSSCLFRYQFPINHLIKQLKYAEQLQLAPLLARQLAEQIEPQVDLVVAMPLHPSKLKQRGFNQAQLLAQQLCHQLHLAPPIQGVYRIRNTPPQAQQTWRERHNNVKNAFQCQLKLDQQRIALVDDVMTSGATLNALALTLRQQGAASIHNWVLARAIPPNS